MSPEEAAEKRRLAEARLCRRSSGWPIFHRLVRGALMASGLARRGLRNALDVQLRQLDWEAPARLDGLRILHLSDSHLDGTPGLAEKLLDLITATPHDLLVWTGDFRFRKWAFSPQELEPTLWLLRRLPPPRLGAWGVLGNHDLALQAPLLEEAGLKILVNQGVEAAPGLWVAGVDDPHHYRSAVPAAALAGRPAGSFALFLAHSPEAAEEAAGLGADLYLCGHTHGGQIRFPAFAPYLNSRAPRQRNHGPFQIGKMAGFTHAGSGSSTLPFRLGCPPEILVHHLKSRKPS
ncbi:MAG: hypothetical protein RL095_1787 [Verrucomicrobiota bacterium]